MSIAWRLNLRFAVVMGVFLGVVLLTYREHGLGSLLAPATTLTAQMTLVILHWLGMEAVRVGTVISHAGGFAYEIYYRCTGFLPVAFLSVSILASPGMLVRKFAGLVVGVPIVIGLNLTRLVHLFYLGVYDPTTFDWAHEVLWEGLIVLAVFGIWFCSTRWPEAQVRTEGRQPTFTTIRRVW